MRIDPNAIYQQKVSDINQKIRQCFTNIPQQSNFKITMQQAINKSLSTNSSNTDITIEYAKSTSSNAKSETQYDDIINETAARYNINPALIKSVIYAESSFNSDCVSSAGAQGLMQLMPSTAKLLNVTDSFDPKQNIDGGVRYLKNQITNFGGDIKMALAAYNCGPTRLRNLNITNLNDATQYSKLPSETQRYINKVMGNIGKFE